MTRPGREVGGLALCQCFVSRDTQELAAVQGAGELCLVTDGVLVVPCLRSIIRADDTDEWAGASVESAKPNCKASAGLCNYTRWTVVITVQTVRREWLFEPLDTNFNFVIQALVVLVEGRVRHI